MPRFVGGDIALVLQSEANIIQPIEQAMAGKFIDMETCGKPMPIVDFLLFKIDSELISLDFRCSSNNFGDFFFS